MRARGGATRPEGLTRSRSADRSDDARRPHHQGALLPVVTKASTADLYAHHGDVNGGWLRSAALGATDGLVSNAARIAGAVGAGALMPWSL